MAAAKSQYYSSFDPRHLQTCILWLDAADTSSLTLSGTDVTQWSDKSGIGNHFTKNAGFPSPVYTTNAVNGLPSISFTGAGTLAAKTQILDNNTISITGTSYTIFAVATGNASRPSHNGYNYVMKGTTNSDFYLFFGNHSTKAFATFTGSASAWTDTNANSPSIITTGNTLLMEMRVSGSTLTPYYNGIAMTNKSLTAQASFTGMRLGDASPDGFTGQNWNGTMSEIIIFSTALSDADRRAVEGYLMWKWGISSPRRDFLPTTISGCQLWLDAATSSSFTFSSGSNITKWTDKSGNARDASAIGVPTWSSNRVNGYGGVVLNGSTNFVGTAANSTNLLTGFVVADMSSTTVNNGRLVSLARAGGDDFGSSLDCALFIRNVANQRLQSFRANTNLSIIDISYDVPFVASGLFTGASNTNYRNGIAGTTVGTSGNFGYTQYGIGNYPQFAGIARFTGNVYEVILYNQSLSSNDRQSIEGYLTWKWGIPNGRVLSNSPYRQNPTFTRPFGPPDLGSNLALWLDAADASSVILSGANASNWLDKSGNNRHFRATGNGTVVPYVTSNPRDAYMNFTGFPGPGGAGCTFDVSDAAGLAVGRTFTVFVVERRTSSQNTNYFFSGNGNTANTNLHIGYRNDTSATLAFYANDLNALIPSFATNSTTRVWGFDYTGSSQVIYSNGSNIGSRANTTNLSSWAGAVMGYTAIGANWYLGEIREVVWCTPSVSGVQRQAIEGYLAWKWGRQSTLDTFHPFKSYYPLTPSFNPLTLSNCGLWLDAADTTTITTNGANVIQWRDKSGNTRHAIASTNHPTFTAGTSYIQFSGANWFSYPSTFLTNTQYTLFYTVKRDVSKAGNFFMSSGNNTTTNTNLHIGYDGNTLMKYAQWANDFTFTVPGFNTTAEPINIWCFQQNATQRLAFLNSSQVGSNNNSTLVSGNTDGLLGVYMRSVSTAWNGKWYEVLMFTRALSATERRQVEGYLAWKWGSWNNLPAGHPFKTLRP